MDAITWDAPDAGHPARRAARASMTAVAGGDKEGWLKLFASDALVEDPVGPSFLDPSGNGHRGHDGIGAFWDTFISTISGFRFTIADSFANGDCCANVATITTTMDDGSTMTIDCVLIYTVDDAGLVTSLRAHWEPDRAMATVTNPPADHTAPLHAANSRARDASPGPKATIYRKGRNNKEAAGLPENPRAQTAPRTERHGTRA